MSVRETIKGQIVGALQGAKFPIATPEDLINAFPNGADTTCQAGDLKVTAGQAGFCPRQLQNKSLKAGPANNGFAYIFSTFEWEISGS